MERRRAPAPTRRRRLQTKALTARLSGLASLRALSFAAPYRLRLTRRFEQRLHHGQQLLRTNGISVLENLADSSAPVNDLQNVVVHDVVVGVRSHGELIRNLGLDESVLTLIIRGLGRQADALVPDAKAVAHHA